MPQLSAASRSRVAAAHAAAVRTLAQEIASEPPADLRDQAGLPSAEVASQLHDTLSRELWSTC